MTLLRQLNGDPRAMGTANDSPGATKRPLRGPWSGLAWGDPARRPALLGLTPDVSSVRPLHFTTTALIDSSSALIRMRCFCPGWIATTLRHLA